jgi:hypothetical protein
LMTTTGAFAHETAAVMTGDAPDGP